jgi:hypothetical protein
LSRDRGAIKSFVPVVAGVFAAHLGRVSRAEQTVANKPKEFLLPSRTIAA